MKTILVILAEGFEEIEVAAPVDILRRLGHNVILAGLSEMKVRGSHDLYYHADVLLSNIETGAMDGIVLPGGAASFTLRDSEVVIQLVQRFNVEGKLVAALCAAPIVLARAGILEGRDVTAFPAIPVYDDIHQGKALLNKEAHVVRDGNIITGRGPGVALDFSFALGEYLGDAEKVLELKETMCVHL